MLRIKELLELWHGKAVQNSADSTLKQSVFGLMSPELLQEVLLSRENRLWHQIIASTETFLDMFDSCPNVQYELDDMVPPPGNPDLQSAVPVIMDQSLREPATNTPFGHTGYMKYLSLKIVKSMRFKDVALTGLFYGDTYTPENQILEEMYVRGEPMASGMAAALVQGAGCLCARHARGLGDTSVVVARLRAVCCDLCEHPPTHQPFDTSRRRVRRQWH